MASESTPLLQAAESHSDPQKLSLRARNWILFAVWVGVFLGALDSTIVVTLSNDISSSFQKSNQAGWLGTSFLLTSATFTPLYGRFHDIAGRRSAVIAATVLFTLGTALCGIAPSMETLIAARLIAGMGGGGMMISSTIICSDLVPLRKRGLYQGLGNLFFGAGSGLGGPVGGWIADTFGWRTAFLMQIPFLLLVLFMLATLIHYHLPGEAKTKREMLERIDLPGAGVLIAALSLFLISLSYKNNENIEWADPKVYASLAVSGVLFAVFFAIEKSTKHPVMPTHILADRSVFFNILGHIFFSMVSFSVLFNFPLIFEVVKLKSAAVAGAHMIPYSIAASSGSLAAGYIIRHTGKYYTLIALSSLIPVASCITIAYVSYTDNWILSWFAVVPMGLGLSSVITSTIVALIAGVKREDMAVATGLSYLARNLGQVIGVAISSSILQSLLATELDRRITGKNSAKIIYQIRHISNSIIELPEPYQTSAVESYAVALKWVFIFNAFISFLCFLCMLLVKEYPLHVSFEEEAEHRRQVESASSETANNSADATIA